MPNYVVTLPEIGARAAIQGLATLLIELRKAGVIEAAAVDAVRMSVSNSIEVLGANVDGADDLQGWAVHMLTHFG